MPDDEGTDQTDDDSGGETDAADLGDAGKRALDRERAKNRALAAENKLLKPQAARAKELEDAEKSESERLRDELAERDRKDAEKDRGHALDRAKSAISEALAEIIPDRKTRREIVEDLNVANYISDEGEIDEKRLDKLVARHAPTGPPGGARMPTGARNGAPSADDMNARIRQHAGR